jgi:hypothetical protein
LHDDCLHHFNSSPDGIRMIICKRIGWRRFVGRPRCRRKNWTKMDLRVFGGVVLYTFGISVVFGTVLLWTR